MTGGKARSWSRPKSRRCTAKRRMAANIRLKRVSAKSAGSVKKGAWGLGYGIGFGAVQSGVGSDRPLRHRQAAEIAIDLARAALARRKNRQNGDGRKY